MQIQQVIILLNFQKSRRNPSDLCGRCDGNIKVIIPNTKFSIEGSSLNQNIKPGDYVTVKVSIQISTIMKLSM